MKLKELRLKRQITQQNLSEKLNINRSTYAMWENGKANPPIDKIYALSEALNVSVGEIVNCILNQTENN